MNKSIEIQNEINRLNGYIRTVKGSPLYSEEEQKHRIADAEKRIEREELEMARLIEVEADIIHHG